MKVPYSWLREYVPAAPPAREMGERLAVIGTEVERVATFGVPAGSNGGDPLDSYRVGRVVSFVQHPNADRLRLCKVDVGEGEPRQIVCGASNFAEGDTVAVVLPGGVLPGGMKIKEAKLRGEDSHGMMLSERELELSTDHGGIMVLPEEWTPGEPLAGHLPLTEQVLELEVTPNRPDCLSIYGVAREVAAAFELPLEDALSGDAEASADGDVSDHVTVSVDAPELCPRYMARAFVDVKVGTSPAWLRARLAAAGMRAINNVVDVTNYVMLATGQPLHAFDADTLMGGTIVVRRANAGEKMTTLDDVERALDADTLLIADAEAGAVIAGVMGAADVEVTEATTRIVLEAANFDGPTIMRTSQRLALRSESSSRFEKGLDPYLPEVGLRMASRLLVELAGARMVPGTVDEVAGGELPALPRVTLTSELLDGTLGLEVPLDDATAILERLGYEVLRTDAALETTVPHWRMRDTTRPIDLVEEVGRVYGLDRIPATLPARSSTSGTLTPGQRMQRALEDAAATLGLSEVVTYSLVPTGSSGRFGFADDQVLRLANPMTNEQGELRPLVVASLLEVVQRNRSVGTDDVRIFEVARDFAPCSGGSGPDNGTGGLPLYADERSVFAVVATGSVPTTLGAPPMAADEGWLAGTIRALLGAVGLPHEVRAAVSSQAWLHPARSGEVFVGGERAGWFGALHPGLLRDLDVRGAIVAAELDLSVLARHVGVVTRYSAIGEFPAMRQDIAVVLSDEVLAGDVVATVHTAGGDLLESVEVFDRYAGATIADGHHSLALKLTFRAPDRTLTDDEAAAARTAIVDALATAHGATLRGSFTTP